MPAYNPYGMPQGDRQLGEVGGGRPSGFPGPQMDPYQRSRPQMGGAPPFNPGGGMYPGGSGPIWGGYPPMDPAYAEKMKWQQQGGGMYDRQPPMPPVMPPYGGGSGDLNPRGGPIPPVMPPYGGSGEGGYASDVYPGPVGPPGPDGGPEFYPGTGSSSDGEGGGSMTDAGPPPPEKRPTGAYKAKLQKRRANRQARGAARFERRGQKREAQAAKWAIGQGGQPRIPEWMKRQQQQQGVGPNAPMPSIPNEGGQMPPAPPMQRPGGGMRRAQGRYGY